MQYQASRGGRAPGHLREMFVDVIEGNTQDPWWLAFGAEGLVVFYDPRMQARWDRWDARERARWLLGQLWNCTDIMPSDLCQSLDLPPGSTYAQAVRRLKADRLAAA